jgi:DNA-binding transcriptional LysR family regulator
MSLDLGLLQAFASVVDCGSFAAAAQRLGLSASVVSRRVAALEAQLQSQLLLRTTRGFSLTEPGERFHAHCRRLLAELDLACEDVRGDGEQLGGLVRITAPHSLLSEALLVPVVADLLAQHPRLRVDIQLDERKVDLVAGAFEVALRIGPVADSRYFARRLALLSGQLVASPDYLARRGVPQGTEQLLEHHHCLVHAEMAAQGLWRMEDGQSPGWRVRVNSFETLRSLARAGAGVAVMPAFAVQDDLANGRLQTVLPGWQSPGFELFAVSPPAPRLSARARLVMDALAAYAARPAERWGEPV